MADFNFCWICKGTFQKSFPVTGDAVTVDCGTCGPYSISLSKYLSNFPLPDSERYRLSFWNKQRELEGRDPVRLDSTSLGAILASLPDPPAHTKPGILLLSLTRQFPEPGRHFKLDEFRQYT